MRIVVIGLGSMGKRRIRLLKRFDSSLEILGVDSSSDRCSEVEEQFRINTRDSVDAVLKDFDIDCAFISCSPLAHAPSKAIMLPFVWLIHQNLLLFSLNEDVGIYG